jgi:hypothetical protein
LHKSIEKILRSREREGAGLEVHGSPNKAMEPTVAIVKKRKKGTA